MIDAPALLPDELANGYLSRARIASGLAPRTFEQLLRKPGESWLRSLAALGGLDFHRFAAMHTLLPYRNAYAYDAVGRAHGTWEPDAVTMRLSLALILPGPRACSLCIAEDLEFWGFPYFRRVHQLPGVEWCVKHRCPLHVLANGAIDDLPHVPTAGARCTTADETVPSSLPILRFMEISAGLLEHPAVASEADLTSAVVDRANELGTETHAPHLGRLLIDSFPAAWLKRLLDVRYSSKGEQRLDRLSIDNRQRRSKPTVLLILALAALFASAEEALAVGRRRGRVADPTDTPARLQRDVPERAVATAFRAFQGGMNLREAAMRHGVGLKRLEDFVRDAIASPTLASSLR